MIENYVLYFSVTTASARMRTPQTREQRKSNAQLTIDVLYIFTGSLVLVCVASGRHNGAS